MATRFVLSPEALQDLAAIRTYVMREVSERAADRLLARIYGALDLLVSMPYIGRERTEYLGTPRSIVVRPYVIFYEPAERGDSILIWRVIHGVRDLEEHIRPPMGRR